MTLKDFRHNKAYLLVSIAVFAVLISAIIFIIYLVRPSRETVSARPESVSKVVEQSSVPQTEPGVWAFVESFEGTPDSPSQELLPASFDYAVTHRTHPMEHFTKDFGTYPADHGMDCTGPDPSMKPLPQHDVHTSQRTSQSGTIDASFFICKDHMMSSMGDVEGYSIATFWPKQEFNFADGGILEWDVNINDNHKRTWYEVLIVPKDKLTVAAAQDFLPIDETYPDQYIVFRFGATSDQTSRNIELTDATGKIIDATSSVWADDYPNDQALVDRRIRRTNRIEISNNSTNWKLEREDGSFDNFTLPINGGIPFEQGVVLFKTHAYTPEKDGNTSSYTFHWDNIRFDGPVVGQYEVYNASDVVYLQTNGSLDVGETKIVTVEVEKLTDDMVLFGQVHNPVRGEVLLSINGSEQIDVSPYHYTYANCYSEGWKSFQLKVDPQFLREGTNELRWTIGERSCAKGESYPWVGFSIKDLELQYNL